MMPITFANIGEENIIRKVGGNPDVKRHLENLGLVAGKQISVVNRLGDNLVLSVMGTRVALSRDLATKIMI